LTLAAALQRRRRPTYFLSQLEPASLALPIKRGGNDWLDADAPGGTEEDLVEVIQEVRRLRPAAVVVDCPQASEAYLSELAAAGPLVVSVDHQAALRFPSNVVVNPLLGPTKESYEFMPGTQLLLGPRYALVRPEVRRVRPLRAQEPPIPPVQPYRALVALGDDDPNLQTSLLVKHLLAVSQLGGVDVIVRSHHPDRDALQALAEANPEKLILATEPAEIMARVPRNHLAITGGGGWSLELACVGVPQIVIVQSESHWPTAQRLEEEGAAICLGWHENVTPATIRQAIQNLVSDPLERQAMSRCGRKLIDGRGPDRLVTALEVMLHPSRLVGEISQAA
jgi:spore coat polysaccharide biosynthesis predicted glycosyltransferase SpsG